MGSFPNKATQFKTGNKQVEIARKGGQSKSPKKAASAQRRWLKDKASFSNKELDIIDQMATDRQIPIKMMQTIFLKSFEVAMKTNNPQLREQASRIGERAFRTAFPNTTTSQTNIQINISEELDKAAAHARKIIELKPWKTKPSTKDVVTTTPTTPSPSNKDSNKKQHPPQS